MPDPELHLAVDGGLTTGPSVSADRGSETDSQVGRLVVLLHGQPGGAEIWRAVEARLAGRGLQVMAIDRPGYGTSTLEPGGFRHNSRAVVDLIESYGSPAVVVAHSWAAGAAVMAAAGAPEAVDGLVLCAPVGDAASVSRLDRVLGRTRLGRGVLRVGLAVGGWIVSRPGGARLFPAAGLGELGAGEVRSVSQPARDRRARWAAAVEQAALVEELDEVERVAPLVVAPTVVLTGSEDTVVPAEAAAALAAYIPHARIVVVHGGHLLPVENPGAVADAVLSMVGESR